MEITGVRVCVATRPGAVRLRWQPATLRRNTVPPLADMRAIFRGCNSTESPSNNIRRSLLPMELPSNIFDGDTFEWICEQGRAARLRGRRFGATRMDSKQTGASWSRATRNAEIFRTTRPRRPREVASSGPVKISRARGRPEKTSDGRRHTCTEKKNPPTDRPTDARVSTATVAVGAPQPATCSLPPSHRRRQFPPRARACAPCHFIEFFDRVLLQRR